MSRLPFRTRRTWLTDAQLILLDRLFDTNASFPCFRADGFAEQWNLRYSHDLNECELRESIHELCLHGVLTTWTDDEASPIYMMTPAGGELWSRERCPVWDRYCTDRYKTLSTGRRLLRVTAVSPWVRDDFVRLFPGYLSGCHAERVRAATLSGDRLLAWRKFDRLHVGLATYDERWPTDLSAAQAEYERRLGIWSREQPGRTWWRDVDELQRFVGPEAERNEC